MTVMPDEPRKLPADVQARVDFVRSVVPKRRHSLIPWIGLIVVVVAVILAVILFVISGSTSQPKAEPSRPVLPKVVNLQPNPAMQAYKSTVYNLSVSYPKGWIINNINSAVNITSPLTTLVNASGSSVKGYVIFSINKPGQYPNGLTVGTDLAVLDSINLSYNQPTQSQAGQTYVSFIQFSTTNTKGGLDLVFVTGNLGYTKDQVIPETDLNTLDPLIYVSFMSCANSLCKSTTPVTIASSSWTGSALSQIIDSMIQSLMFY